MSEGKICPDAGEGGSSSALSRVPAPADPIPVSPIEAANVSRVQKYSPLRYPGGKTWLIPHIHQWLEDIEPRPKLLVEPFAGGGIVSLTAVMEGLVDRCLMVELDYDVWAFWHIALKCNADLRKKVQEFRPTREAVETLQQQTPVNVFERGFRTLVVNRTRRGGVLAPGASLIRVGESGKGVASRWYPKTLIQRLTAIADHADRIQIHHDDGMKCLEAVPDDAVLFVDPPYSAGGKQAGRRLYSHNEIDHGQLFALLADMNADFLMTYDRTPEIEILVHKHGFHVMQVLMKNTHHEQIPELVISRRPMKRNEKAIEHDRTPRTIHR